MKKLIPFASVLSVAALLANLAAPFSVYAATAISVVGVQTINVSATSTDYKDLGDVKVKVTVNDLDNQDFFFLRLPVDFKINIPAATSSTTDISGAMVTMPDGTTEPLVQVIGGGSDPWHDGAGNHVAVYQTRVNELKVVVKNAAKAPGGTDADTTLKISLGSVYVPGNTITTIDAVIEGKAGSAFQNDSVTVAKKGIGLVSVSVDSLITLPEGGKGKLDTIRFQEDVSGALKAGSESIMLKLPYGFEWTNDSYPVSFVDGDSGAIEEITATRSSDARELEITVPVLTNEASYFTLDQAAIEAKDSTTAGFGDIVVEISGASSMSTNSLAVGNYTDYKTSVSAQNPKLVLTGRMGMADPSHTEIGQIVIEENAPGSMRSGGTIRIELTGGAKWAVDAQGQLVQPPQIAAFLSDLQGLEMDSSKGKNGWELVDSSGKTIKATLKKASNGTKGAKLVLEKGLVDLATNVPAGEVHAILDGTAGVKGDAGVIAQIAAPVTIELADSFKKPVQGGVQNQTINDIDIKETVAGAIGSKGNDSYIRLSFESGIVPMVPDDSQIHVDGDLVLDVSKVTTKTDALGNWFIQIPVQSASTKPSVITLKGQKVTVDRSVPEGDLMVTVSGSMVQTESDDSIGRIAAANVIIPKNGNVMNSAVFVIGSTAYTVNGQQKTSDAAPFIDKNGRTQLPVRAVAEAFGAIVGWDPEDHKVTILKDGKAISIIVGSWVMNVNGVFVQNDSPAINKGGRVYLPIRVIAEALGANVGWDASTQTVYLN